MHVFSAWNQLYNVAIYRSFRPGFNFMLVLALVQSDPYILTKRLKYLKIFLNEAPCCYD